MFFSRLLIYGMRLVFLINGGYLLFTAEWGKGILLLVSLGLTFIPEIYTKYSGIYIPIGAKLSYNLFIFGCQWLGTYLRLYDLFEWWDVLLHFSSGFLIGYIGLLLWMQLDRNQVLLKNNNLKFIIIFITLVSITGAAVWEMAEFSADTFFGMNTQLGSLQDTMEDMVYGTIAALLFSVYTYITTRKNKWSPLVRLLDANKIKENK